MVHRVAFNNHDQFKNTPNEFVLFDPRLRQPIASQDAHTAGE